MSLAAAALLLPALTAAVPSLGDRLVAGYAKQWSLPLTVSKATEAGWTAATGDPTACDVVSGRQFRFGELLTPTLIFDAMGSLAGVQIVVNETTYPSYPQSNWRPSGWWFTATGDPPELSSLALHFKDPAKLCSAEAVDEAGSSIGDRLWLRLTSDDFEQLPLIEEEVQAGMPDSGWNLGRCLPSNVFYPGSLGMGLHYWRHVGRTTASACEDAGPVFLTCTSTACSSVLASYCSGRVVQQPSEACSHPFRHRGRPSRPVTRRLSSRGVRPFLRGLFSFRGPHPLAWPTSRSGTAPLPALPT